VVLVRLVRMVAVVVAGLVAPMPPGEPVVLVGAQQVVAVVAAERIMALPAMVPLGSLPRTAMVVKAIQGHPEQRTASLAPGAAAVPAVMVQRAGMRLRQELAEVPTPLGMDRMARAVAVGVVVIRRRTVSRVL
jgi:hypothetical protein